MDVVEKGREDLGVAMATGGGSHFPEKFDANGSFKTVSADYVKNKEANDRAKVFHANDNRVLRFESFITNAGAGTLADRIVGAEKKYAINYYLGDKTMEIRLIKNIRLGYDEVPSLYKRALLAKNWKDMQSGKDPVYYEPSDLVSGKSIECFGRSLKIIDCDAFTRTF